MTTKIMAAGATTTFRSERPRRRFSRCFKLGWGTRRAYVIVGCCALFGANACQEPDARKAASNSKDTQVLSQVRAPAHLVAELFIQSPAANWQRLRALAGASAAALPNALPAFIAERLDLPALASALDGASNAFGALTAEPGSRPSLVLALPLRDVQALRERLITGPNAAYAARQDVNSAIELLEPLAVSSGPKPVLGVHGNYLLVAVGRRELLASGAYVVQSLPKRVLPSAPIALVARRSSLMSEVPNALRWALDAYSAKLAGVPAKFTSPQDALTMTGPPLLRHVLGGLVESWAEALGSAQELRFLLVLAEDRIEARLELLATDSGPARQTIHSLKLGDLAPLLALPKESGVAIVTRSSLQERLESAAQIWEPLAEMSGKKPSPAERGRLNAISDSLARGRGDFVAWALLTEPEPALAFRLPLADAAMFEAGIKGLILAAELPAIAEPLERYVGRISVRQGVANFKGIGSVFRARVRLKPPIDRHGDPASRDFEFMWHAAKGGGVGVAAARPAAALERLKKTDESVSLSAHAEILQAAERLGTSVGFCAMADPAKLGLLAGTHDSAPVLVTLGRTTDTGWLRVEVSERSLRALLKAVGH